MNCDVSLSLYVNFKYLQKQYMKLFFIINKLNLADKYRIINTTDCSWSNAQCDRIDNYCVCHCHSGYIVVNGYCVKGKRYRTFKHDQLLLLVYVVCELR